MKCLTSFLLLVLALSLAGMSHAAVLSLSSSRMADGVLSVAVGDTVTVEVRIDTEGQQVRGLECFITLPDSVFEVIDADPARAGVQPFRPEGFIRGSVTFNRLYTDSAQGLRKNKLDYGEISQERSGSGVGVVATFRVAALKAGSNLRMTLDSQFPLRVTQFFVPGDNDSASFRLLNPLQTKVVGFPISALPDILIPVAGSNASVDLDDFVEHSSYTDLELNWTAGGFDATLVSVAIDAFTHVVTLRDVGNRPGETKVVFTASDPDGKSGSASASVAVTVGPSIVGLRDTTVLIDTVVHLSLDDYVEDADNAVDELVWGVTGGDRIAVALSQRVLTLTPATGWTGQESLTFAVRDPNGSEDQKTVVVTVRTQQDTFRGPMITGLEDITILMDKGVQINLDDYVQDEDNTDDELVWEVAGGSKVAVLLVQRVLTLTPVAGWLGKETFTFTVTDPDDIRDQKTVSVTVTDVPPSPPLVLAGMVGLMEQTTGDTLLYADAGDTLRLDVVVNVGSVQANGIELFVVLDGRYFAPVDMGPDAGLQPFLVRGVIPGSQIPINRVDDLPDTAWVYLRYAEVSLAGTVSDTTTVTGFNLKVVRSVPAGQAAFIFIENDTLNQRKSAYSVPSGETFALVSRNRVEVRNRPPVLLLPGVLQGVEDEALTLGLDGWVVDAQFTPQEMTWTASVYEEGFLAAVRKMNGVQQVIFTPPADWHGETSVLFHVTDPEGAANFGLSSLVLSPVNDPPVFAGTVLPGITMEEDQTVAVALNELVSDVDDAVSTLVWSLELGKMISVEVDSEMDALRVSASADWYGQDTLLVTVADTSGAIDVARLPVQVTPVNDPPVFSSPLLQVQNVNRDTLLDLSGYVADVDDDTAVLVWKVENASTLGASISEGGKLLLTVPGGWADSEALILSAEDPHGASGSATLLLYAAKRGDFDGNGEVGFSDFIAFALHFGSQEGGPGYSALYDLDANGSVGFSDFVQFALLFSSEG